MRKLDKLYVEITNVCNLRCPFCPESGRAPDFVSVDRFKLLLSRISGKADGLYFHLKGEPLLHPDLGTLIDLAGGSGFSVMLTTNGTLLAERAESLLGRPALKRLNVSLHSLETVAAPEERSAALRRTLAAVQSLRDDTRFAPKVISLRLWNRADAEATGALVAEIERFFGLAPGSLAENLSDAKGALVRSGLSVHPAERFRWPDLRRAGDARYGDDENRDGKIHGFCHGYCRGLRDQAGILVDGTVVPCCLDGEGDIGLGNIYETDWDAIMAGPRARALYDGFSQRRVVEPLCRTCGYRERFD